MRSSAAVRRRAASLERRYAAVLKQVSALLREPMPREGNSGRTRIDITFPSGITPGSKVWFTAFWFNEKKQAGPTTTPVGTNIPGGAAMAA